LEISKKTEYTTRRAGKSMAFRLSFIRLSFDRVSVGLSFKELLKRCLGGTLKTINRIKDIFARLKLKRDNYARRASFIAMTTVLLVSFQNCSQGKFEIDEAQITAASKSDSNVNGNGNGGDTGGGGTPVPPPTGNPPPGPVMPTQAEIDAELARKNRCKSAVKMPVFVNTADFASKVLSLKSGLAPESGDVSISNNPRPITVTVDASQGIDSTKYLMSDLCAFRTQIIAEPVTGDSSRPAVWNYGIDLAGAELVTADVNGKRASDYMTASVQRNTSVGNNDTDFTPGVNSIGINYQIRQTQNNNQRVTRCADGSIYYRFKIRVETQGLQTVKPNYPANTGIANVVLETGYQYARIDIENNCWKENNLTKIMGAASPTSIPATNSNLGTAAAADGEWAASVSGSEGGTGYIYIFRKVAGSWTFFQKLKGQNGNGTVLTGLALKSGLLVVSSAGDGMGYPGRVFLYNLDGNQLTSAFQIIDNPVGPGTKFGSGVAVAGNSIAIGDSKNEGRAYLYTLNGGLYGAGSGASRTPSVTQTAAAISGSIVGFGSTVVCQNGRLLIGAYNGNEGYAGSVHIFDANGGSFGSPVHKYAPAAITSKGNFGHAIAFDGTALAVGAYENETGGNAAGALVYYANYSSADAPHVIQGSAAEERFGVSLAFAGDSLYVGSRGGSLAPGGINRYKLSDLAAKRTYNSMVFVQHSHDAANGEGFSYSLSAVGGAASPTLMVSAQTKDYIVSVGNTRSKAGAVYIYEVK
jgi:hypothetical protein